MVSPRSKLYAASLKRSAGAKRLARALGIGRMLSGASLLHATAPSETEAISTLGLPGTIATIPNGIDLSFAERLPAKRAHVLLDAWAASGMAEQGWQLVVAGSGDPGYLASLERRLPSHQAAGVSWPEHLEGRAKLNVLAACDLFALPSAFENFGIAIAEALACRLPVVTTDATPWGNLERQRAGRIVPVGSVEALARALEDLSRRPAADLEATGRRGRQLVEGMTWPSAARDMAAAYRQTISSASTNTDDAGARAYSG